MFIPQPIEAKNRRIVVHTGTLIDGTGGTPVKSKTLIVQDGTIEDILDRSAYQERPEDIVIDAEDMVLLPGLWDGHVHVRSSGHPSQRSLTTMEASVPKMAFWGLSNGWCNIEYGVTSIRDMSSIGYMDVALRDAINEDIVPGPRMFVAGHGLTMHGGHMDPKRRPEIQIRNHTGLANDPYEVKAAARYQLAQGADLIKFNTSHSYIGRDGSMVLPQEMDYEMLRAGVEEAEKAGASSATHCHGGQGAMDAIRAGVRCIEHGHWLTDAHFELMLEMDTYFCPTLACNENRLRLGQEKVGMSDRMWTWLQRACADKRDTITRAMAAGIKIVSGSDAGMPYTFHGAGAADEMIYLVEYGMKPMDALVAATRTPAELLGIDDYLGTLEKGKAADFIVLDKNPLDDIAVLKDKENTRLVFKAGTLMVDRLGISSKFLD